MTSPRNRREPLTTRQLATNAFFLFVYLVLNGLIARFLVFSPPPVYLEFVLICLQSALCIEAFRSLAMTSYDAILDISELFTDWKSRKINSLPPPDHKRGKADPNEDSSEGGIES